MRGAQRVARPGAASSARRARASSQSEATMGRIMMPTTMAALAALKTCGVGDERLQQRRHRGEREVAVDHRRDAGQDLQHRLDEPAHALGGVLAEVDGAAQAHGNGDERRADHDHEGAAHERQHAEAARREQRRPAGAEEELEHRHLAQEAEGLRAERQDDAQRGEDGHEGAQEQQAPDAFFPPAARPFEIGAHRRLRSAGRHGYMLRSWVIEYSPLLAASPPKRLPVVRAA